MVHLVLYAEAVSSSLLAVLQKRCVKFHKKYYTVNTLDVFQNWKKLQGVKRGGSRANVTEKPRGSGWLKICGKNRKESEIFDD